MNTERRYDIDWLRVISIGLLLIYHIAIIFQPWALFIGFMRSEQLHEGLWQPMTMLNVWRIPILFYVSGMGVFFAIQRRNIKQLLIDRGLRIGLPFVFGILAIVPLHWLFFQNFYQLPLNYQAQPAHLWFLGNILIYISLLFPLFFYLIKNPNNLFRRLLIRLMHKPWGPLLVLPFFVLEVLIVQPDIFSLYAQTLHGYAIGFLAFLFGFILVYTGDSFWKTISKGKYYYLVVAGLLYFLRLYLFPFAWPQALLAVESNLWIFGIFGLAHQYLNKPSKVLSYLSQAAYPIYIIHMFVMYGVATVVLPTALPALVQFALIIFLSFTFCFGLYELIIKRITFLGPLFGLKYKTKERATKGLQSTSSL